MENYSRTAMHVPFEEYLKKIAKKQQPSNNSEVNPDSFKGGGKPAAVIGEIYPDLYSQAAYINKDIAEIKAAIVESVKSLFDGMGEDVIKTSIDSIYTYVDSFLGISDEEEYCFTKKGVFELSNQVYCLVNMTKTLLDLYLKHQRLKEMDNRSNLTKRNILL